jgi:hypothetical protein
VDAEEARGLAWDFRNTAVRRAHPDEKHAAEFRARRIADLTRAGGDFSKIRAQADADVDAEMQRFRTEDYKTFLREYRDGLEATRRIAGLGFVLTARRADERLDLGVRVLFAAP